MDKNALAKQLRTIADEVIDKELLLADAFYKISDYLTDESTNASDELDFRDFGTNFSPRTRVKLLSNILMQLHILYEASLSAKQISYVIDLIEKIEVGYFDDEENDSSFAKQLRIEKYKLSARDSEFSLQVRISNLLQELMPSGAWVVE